MNLNLTWARYVLLGGALLCIVAIVALILALVLRGGVASNGSSVAGLISFVGILVALASSLIGQAATTHALNSHLETHEGPTAQQIRDLVDQELARRGFPPTADSEPRWPAPREGGTKT